MITAAAYSGYFMSSAISKLQQAAAARMHGRQKDIAIDPRVASIWNIDFTLELTTWVRYKGNGHEKPRATVCTRCDKKERIVVNFERCRVRDFYPA